MRHGAQPTLTTAAVATAHAHAEARPADNDGAGGVEMLQVLTDHVYEHFRIHLRAMPLVQVAAPVAVVNTDGRLKICGRAHAMTLQVLQQVTALALTL